MMFFSKKTKKNWKIFLSVILLAILIYFLPIPFIQEYKTIILSRIINPQNADISGGRISLWTDYLKYSFKSIDRILFGIGINNYHIRSGVGNVAHNIVLGSIVTQGLFGFILMMLLYYRLFRKTFQPHISTNQKQMILISIIVLIFSYSTLDALGNYVSIIALTQIAGLSSLSQKFNYNNDINIFLRYKHG